MAQAARAIIFDNNKLLVMRRNKHGTEYYTLVGGHIQEGETAEQAVIREVKEETGLEVIEASLAFIENHPDPYANQQIFLCKVAAYDELAIQDTADEALLNKLDMNVHTPQWVSANVFPRLPFSTIQLQKAIVDALQNGFPEQPITLP